MSWDADFFEEDLFPVSFPEPLLNTGPAIDFRPPFVPIPAGTGLAPAQMGSVRSYARDLDGQSLANENAELRRTAVSLRERFAQITTVNERLKTQLQECRSKFRNAVCAGFTATRK
jgi:hypothetical protein